MLKHAFSLLLTTLDNIKLNHHTLMDQIVKYQVFFLKSMAKHGIALVVVCLFSDRRYLGSLVSAYITAVILSHWSGFQKVNMPSVCHLSL